MKKILILKFILVFVFADCLYSQTTDFQLGTPRLYQTQNGGYYDYSRPDAVNMNVAIWGFVKFPGRYLIPSTTTLDQLVSFAGGPSNDADLDEMKLYRRDGSEKEVVIDIDYSELWEGKGTRSPSISTPLLIVDDIVVVPGSRRLYFDDWARLGLSFLSAIISIATFIVVSNN